MSKPPFFIVGIGRSGTTLLRLMLHNHPNIAIPYESHFVTDYQANAAHYGDLEDDSNLRKLIDDVLREELLQQWDHDFKAENIIAQTTERSLTGVFDAIYMDYAKAKGKQRWGDKSDYLDRMHIINKVFPTAKFIHIIRDGRDVANSVMKMTWGPSDIIQASEWWHLHIKLGRCMGAILGDDRYTEVKYENLVNNSEAELKRLCDFLDEDYSPQMLNYHQSANAAIPEGRAGQHYNADAPPKKSRTFAWKKEMSATNISIFNNYAQNSLEELGYECPHPVGGLKLKLAKVMVYLKRML